jgi:hypothetical protein
VFRPRKLRNRRDYWHGWSAFHGAMIAYYE